MTAPGAPTAPQPSGASGARVVLSIVILTLSLAISVVWAYTASTRSAADAEPARVTGNRVLAVGDSLLWQSGMQVQAALKADHWDPTLATYPGTTIGQWTGLMGQLVEQHRPDAVVLELGTNNCVVTCANLDRTIDELMSHIPRTTPVLWLNVQLQPSYPINPEAVNDALALAQMRWSNLKLIDMSAHFRNHPEWHVEDGLHLTSTGSGQLAGLITQTLRGVR